MCGVVWFGKGCAQLRAIGVEAGSTEIKIGTPFPIDGALDVVTSWVLRQRRQPHGRSEHVGGVHILDVAQVAGLSESFLRKLAAAHGGGRVVPLWLRVDNLPSPLQHGRTACKVCEYCCWPVAYQMVVPELHPPVALAWVLQCAHLLMSETLQLYPQLTSVVS